MPATKRLKSSILGGLVLCQFASLLAMEDKLQVDKQWLAAAKREAEQEVVMSGSNLAENFPLVGEPKQQEKPQLKLVEREAGREYSSAEKRHWFADNMDTVLLIVAVGAWIIGYTAFGILAVAGR
jgi:hypothetical protein